MPHQGTNSWRPRDYLAAVMLFAGTAGFVLWQNSRVAVLWDLGYLLDTSWRIAHGQMPYRDFPLAHAPLTFLIQAAIMRLSGRHYLLPVAYAALAGGLATVLTWRILVCVIWAANVFGRSGWLCSVLFTAPLTVLGIYSIYPHPIYDCDCTLAILIAIYLLGHVPERKFSSTENSVQSPSHLGIVIQPETFHPERSAVPGVLGDRSSSLGWALRRGVEGSAVAFLMQIPHRIPITALAAGAATVLPLFFKQNIGLPFLALVVTGMLILLAAELRQPRSFRSILRSQPLFVLAGMAIALIAGIGIVAVTAGLGNYVHWTVQFAAQRRLPGLASMLDVYQQPSFAWILPTLAAGLFLCHTRFIVRSWARVAAICLMAAPFIGTLIFLLINDDADERADNLLALWPLLLLAALMISASELRRPVTLRRLIPFFVLAAIHGTFLSQQLWGSTYALWPLLIVLVASIFATLPAQARPAALVVSAAISATFLVCGVLYAASFERLRYIQIPDQPLRRSSIPALRGMAMPGPFLPNFDELVRFTQREIPPQEALLLLPGEDPFYYATGRTPSFPVTLFDPATDPYSVGGLMDEARRRNVRWVIVKRALQINGNPMPEFEQTMQIVQRDFALYRRLQGYDVYRRE